MATYPVGLPVGYVTLSILDLIGDLGATGDGDDLPDVADVTLTVEMVPTAKMITYGGKGYRLRSYTWTGTSTLTAPDGTGSYALPSTDTLTQAGTGWQWQARISVAAGSTTTQLTTPAFNLAAGATVDLLPLIPLEAQSLDVSALVIIPPGTALPEQAGQAGKVLTTDGASASWSTPSAAADWSTLSGKPAAIGAGATAAAARAAIGAGTSDLVIGTTSGTAADAADVTTALAGKASSSHTHTATGISDSTTVGRSVLTASTATAARTAIGAGTSSLALGSTDITAAAGDHGHLIADVNGLQAALDAKAATSSIGTLWRYRSTADWVVNNQTTITAVTGFSMPIAAGEEWDFSIILYLQGDAAADAKVVVDAPSGATGHYVMEGSNTGAAGPTGTSKIEAYDTYGTVGQAIGTFGDTSTSVCKIEGTIVNGATAGNVTIKAAQSVATAVDTKVLAGSVMAASKVVA